MSRGTPEADREERDHLAGRGGGRIDPVGLARAVVRGVVVDHDPRQSLEELRVSPADLADAVERAAVRDHHEVVVAVRTRVGPDAVDLREVVVQGRGQVGGDRIGRPAEGLDEPDDAQRRPERVGVGVLVADRQDASGAADPLDHEVRHGVEVRGEIDGHRPDRGLAWLRLGPYLRFGRGGGRAAAGVGSSGRSPSCGSRATGVGRTSTPFGSSVGDLAELDVVQELQDAGAALGGVVELDVEVRDAPQAQPRPELVADERHRPAERLHGRGPFRGLPDDADPDLRVAQVRRRLDARDRHEPDPRIRDIASHDRRDLLSQKLVDLFGSLAHRGGLPRRPVSRRPRGSPFDW